ncbi:MAG: polyprenyl synthetase family protein [Myxococcales bacterium]|nr:polyprenyl synthetase family protein [Myxococcales bacterium]
MNASTRIENALRSALALGEGAGRPPRLSAALHHAVFPAGGRVRPQLALAVARACGDSEPALVDACAVAVELCHCASLVHDDLPCFDDADHRRGMATVHRAFGEGLAVLVGDGLIALAFEVIARAPTLHPERLGAIVRTLAQSIGAGRGLVAGQAWEQEDVVSIGRYHRAKTGALFEAAAVMAATACGHDAGPWRRVAAAIGEAYQVADDLADILGGARDLGKPVGQDLTHDRPSAVRSLGIEGAFARIEALRGEAEAALPECAGRGHLIEWLGRVVERLLPAAQRPARAANWA